jgi:Mechanosensitive ion channel, conserved TM helix
MDEFTNGLGDAWASIAEFLPKLVGFLLILVVGYFVAKAIAGILSKVLERIGFDKAVERGGVGKALESSKYDASGILSKIVFYALFLFVLQLAFGIFGPNPISDLIKGVIAYLPNIFVAIVIVVIGAAIAAAVKELVEAAFGGLSYGRALAFTASAFILGIALFAALDQLNIAPRIVTGLFYALLAIVVGSAVIAIGGGGIKTMSKYWEKTAARAEEQSSTLKEEAGGSKERIQQRAQERKEQFSGGSGSEGEEVGARRPDRV